MLLTEIASSSAMKVRATVATRVRTSSFWSLSRGQIEPITLLQSSDDPASSELSAELMIAEISAARKTVSTIG